MRRIRGTRDYSAADDHTIVSRLEHGDEEAYAELFDRHSGAVFRYAWGLADVRSDVDDLVQETFLVVWRRRDSIRIVGSSALPWLLTTCRNVSLNVNRQRRRVRFDEISDVTVDSPAWYRRLEQEAAAEQLAWVHEALASLTDLDRRLCELCLLEGRTYDDAAMILGLTPTAARKRIQRSRAQLRAARATD